MDLQQELNDIRFEIKNNHIAYPYNIEMKAKPRDEIKIIVKERIKDILQSKNFSIDTNDINLNNFLGMLKTNGSFNFEVESPSPVDVFNNNFKNDITPEEFSNAVVDYINIRKMAK